MSTLKTGLTSCLIVLILSAPMRNQSKLTRLFCTELEIFNIQSEQQQQRDDDLQSCAVHANCLRTACELRICSSWRTELEIFNLLFVEGTHLDHQNRQRN